MTQSLNTNWQNISESKAIYRSRGTGSGAWHDYSINEVALSRLPNKEQVGQQRRRSQSTWDARKMIVLRHEGRYIYDGSLTDCESHKDRSDCENVGDFYQPLWKRQLQPLSQNTSESKVPSILGAGSSAWHDYSVNEVALSRLPNKEQMGQQRRRSQSTWDARKMVVFRHEGRYVYDGSLTDCESHKDRSDCENVGDFYQPLWKRQLQPFSSSKT